jgi:hypothetical protein
LCYFLIQLSNFLPVAAMSGIGEKSRTLRFYTIFLHTVSSYIYPELFFCAKPLQCRGIVGLQFFFNTVDHASIYVLFKHSGHCEHSLLFSAQWIIHPSPCCLSTVGIGQFKHTLLFEHIGQCKHSMLFQYSCMCSMSLGFCEKHVQRPNPKSLTGG